MVLMKNGIILILFNKKIQIYEKTFNSKSVFNYIVIYNNNIISIILQTNINKIYDL